MSVLNFGDYVTFKPDKLPERPVSPDGRNEPKDIYEIVQIYKGQLYLRYTGQGTDGSVNCVMPPFPSGVVHVVADPQDVIPADFPPPGRSPPSPEDSELSKLREELERTRARLEDYEERAVNLANSVDALTAHCNRMRTVISDTCAWIHKGALDKAIKRLEEEMNR